MASYGAYLGDSLIEIVLKPFECDAKILLLNFLVYLQIARRYLLWFHPPKIEVYFGVSK